LSDGVPRWSPDGTRIAFVSYSEDTGNDIYTMNPDGSGVTLLADNPDVPRSLAWSPDGTRIAFSAIYKVNAEIYDSELFIMNTDGSVLTRLTDNPAWDDWPAWSPYSVSTPTPQPPQVFPFVVSGTLSYRKQALVADNARVVVVWLGGEAAGDDSYVFGEGTIDPENGSFELVFDAPPPPEALYWDGSSAVGFGLLLLTTDQGLGTGSSLSESSETDFLGASEQNVILYVGGSFEAWGEEYSWLAAFRQGYSVGTESELSGMVLEEPVPTDPTTVELIVDELQNIEYPLWW
jgi:hypothetical protein